MEGRRSHWSGCIGSISCNNGSTCPIRRLKRRSMTVPRARQGRTRLRRDQGRVWLHQGPVSRPREERPPSVRDPRARQHLHGAASFDARRGVTASRESEISRPTTKTERHRRPQTRCRRPKASKCNQRATIDASADCPWVAFFIGGRIRKNLLGDTLQMSVAGERIGFELDDDALPFADKPASRLITSASTISSS